jgi:hypothetical protein
VGDATKRSTRSRSISLSTLKTRRQKRLTAANGTPRDEYDEWLSQEIDILEYQYIICKDE